MEVLLKNKATRALLGGLLSLPAVLLWPTIAVAGEANLVIPNLTAMQNNLLLAGIVVCILGMLFAFYQFTNVNNLRDEPGSPYPVRW